MSGGSRRRSAAVAAGIVLSRVSGLVRERALSHFLGTTFAADAFTAAFRLPGMLQRLGGEGVLSAAFIPSYSRLLAEGRKKEAGRMAGAVLGLLTAATAVVVLLGVVFAQPLTWAVAAGFHSRPRTFDLTVQLVRILFPAAGFFLLSAWCLSILNSHRRFFLPYVAPVVLNLAQIGVLVGLGVTTFAHAFTGAHPAPASARSSLAIWLSVGTIAGGLLQFGIQLPAVIRLNRGMRISMRTSLPGVRTTIRAVGPVVAARGLGQLSGFVQLLMASFLAGGGLATLRYAQILYQLPNAVFGRAVAAAELPEFARADPHRHTAELTGRLSEGLARIAAFIVPTVIGYLLIGDLITAAVFQTGEFSRVDTLVVWVVLAGYALGLLARASSRLLKSALYGIGNTRTPARIAVLRMVITVAVGFVLMWQLDRIRVSAGGIGISGHLPAFGPLPVAARSAASAPGVATLGTAGLSIAAAVSAWVEYALLRRAVGQRIGPVRLGGGQLSRVVVAGLIAGAVGYGMRWVVAGLPPLPAGVVAVAALAVAYAAAASALGVSEIRHVLGALVRRLDRS